MSRRPVRAVLFVCALLPACLGPSGTEMSAAEYAEWEASQRVTELPSAPPQQEGPSAEELDERADELAMEQLELDHALEQLERDRELAALRRGLAVDEARQALSRARTTLSTAQAELQFFTAVGQARALDALALELQRAEDSLLETREELAQLELMYGQDLGEATAEIVLSRTRRRVARAEERLRLEQLEARHVREVELPARLVALTQAVTDGEAAVRVAEGQLELGELTARSEEAERELEAALLQHRVAAQARRAQALEEDRREAQRRDGQG